jgi:3'-5' exoribonuclease
MARCFVNQLNCQEAINEVYRASEKQLRPNRNGHLYLQFELSDRTGKVGARMWNATEAVYRSFENGDYVRVEGNAQLFQGTVQVIVTRLAKVEPEQVNPDDFTPLRAVDIDKLMVRLGEILREPRDPALQALAESFLGDEELLRRLAQAPAGVKHHHAYQGGLLEHTVNLLEVVLRIAPCYPRLDRDLLLMGAFLHDLGKLDELAWERELTYTDEGQMLGHVVVGLRLLDAKLAEAEKLAGEPLPHELALRLRHMLVSHHGEYEFGSPKLPMTLEAVALCCLDNLDAKLNAFQQLIHDDPNVDSPWTNYHPQLNRKLFKGRPSSA